MTLTMCVFLSQDPPAVAAHCFEEGMKLEAVDPAAPISIRPATVTKVILTLLCCSVSLLFTVVALVIYVDKHNLSLVNSAVKRISIASNNTNKETILFCI